MKKILIAFVAACMIASCGSDDKDGKSSSVAGAETDPGTENHDTTSIQWLDSTFMDLGTIKEGQVAEVRFHFKNSGNKNLVIENVSASCGCTVPEKPEEPIPPGGEDVIKAKFDSRGKLGEQQKTVTVKANIPEGSQTLRFKVQVAKG